MGKCIDGELQKWVKISWGDAKLGKWNNKRLGRC